MRDWISQTFWSTYRDSPVVRDELDKLLGALAGGAKGLNVGSGDRGLHPRLINLDRTPAVTTDCVADARRLPFASDAFDLVMSQEVVEHVPDPFLAVREMARVLNGGGTLYLQVPFILGYHPDPDDYWRFTHAGVRQLIEQAALRCERVQPSLASATGLHRILVDFVASTAARVIPTAYLPVKGVVAVILYPIKWIDGWLIHGAQRDRIAGGYFGIGRKRN